MRWIRGRAGGGCGGCAVLLLGRHAAAPAEPMRILTAGIPPLAYVEDGRVMGFCVDVVREIQRRIDDRSEIQAMPWPAPTGCRAAAPTWC